jgi:hypothetical protein
MLTALLTSPVSAIVENVRATIIFEKQFSIAQQWTLPSRARMLGDVGTPQFIGSGRGELAVDQVGGGVQAKLQPAPPPPAPAAQPDHLVHT